MNSIAAARKASPWLYYYTILLALCALFLVLSGAAVTSSHAAPSASDRTSLPDQVEQSFPVPAGAFLSFAHPVFGRVLGAGTLGLVAWLFVVEKQEWLRRLSWLALLLVLLNAGLGEAMLGSERSGRPASPAMVVSHAFLAHILFSTIVVISLLASPGWRRGAEPVHDKRGSFLPLLVTLVPVLVILQIAFGALYRHQVFGVMEHMAGAALVTGLALILCLQVLQKFPKHRSLLGAALALMGIVLLQVSLGITVFVMELLKAGSTAVLLLSTFAHVTNGSMTLAASLVFAIQVQRNVLEAPALQADALRRI